MLFVALCCAACHSGGGPAVQERLRIGLGATALALGPDGKSLAVACRRSNDVWILDMASGQGLARIDTGLRPRALFFHGEKAAFYVAEGLSPKASVALIKLGDQRVARRYHPRGLLSRWLPLQGEDRLLSARLGEPLLGVYRLKDWHLLKAVPMGGEVTALAQGKDAWWAATRQADALARLSPRSLSLQAVALAGPEPRGLALDDGAGKAYLACQGRQGEAVPLALPSPTFTPGILSPLSESAGADAEGDTPMAAEEPEDVDEEPQASVAGPLTHRMEGRYDGGGVAVFRLSDTRRLDYIEVPGGPTHAVLSPGGGRLALACADGKLRMLDLGRRRVAQVLRLGGTPGAMLLSPDKKELWIALGDAKQLLRVRPGEPW